MFIECALEGNALPVYGDGSQTRCFTYISDHVEGITRCLEDDAANNQVFNLGHTREIRILDLAHMIWWKVRSDEPRIEIFPYESFGSDEDIHRRVPDISLAKRVLGFAPTIGLDEGLHRTIEWHRAQSPRAEPVK